MKSRFRSARHLSLVVVSIVSGQTLSPTIQKLSVSVHGCSVEDVEGAPEGPNGMGFIVGDRKRNMPTGAQGRTLYILTAAHVVGEVGNRAKVRFNDRMWSKRAASLSSGQGTRFVECKVIASEMAPLPPRDADYALLACDLPQTFRGSFSYSAVGSERELRSRSSLLVSVNQTAPEKSPVDNCASPSRDPALFPYYFVFDQFTDVGQSIALKNKPAIEFFNPLQLVVKGASGGPLMTDRSELEGMVYEATLDRTIVRAFTWRTLDTWLKDIPNAYPGTDFDPRSIKLKYEDPSAAELRRYNLEVSAGTAAVDVPGFGWLPVTPTFRASTMIPGVPGVRLAFDFVSTQGTSAGGAETVKFTVPAITGEFHIGSVVSELRRHKILGGVYVAGGVAPTIIQRTLLGFSPTNIDSVASVFDAGWRYRVPGRAWGLQASYREAIVHEGLEGAFQVYPRFRSASLGMFYVFK